MALLSISNAAALLWPLGAVGRLIAWFGLESPLGSRRQAVFFAVGGALKDLHGHALHLLARPKPVRDQRFRP